MLALRKHQIEKLEEVKVMLETHDIVCLAALTGFGKTEVAAQFIREKERKRTLVLPHGLTTLRAQFSRRLKERLGKTKVYEATGVDGMKAHSDNYDVVVALPQTAHKCLNLLQNFDYIIVDEAHQFYGEAKKMYEAILKSLAPKCKHLLLTGTHYNLNCPKVYFSRAEAFSVDAADDVPIRLVQTSEKLTLDDFSKDREVSEGFTVSIAPLMKALKPLLSIKHYPMLITVDSIPTARNLLKYLKRRKINATASWSGKGRDSDPNSQELEAFAEGKYDVCVVVNRAVLGFDYKELCTVVDASYSLNIPRIEQTIGRLMRRPDKPRDKLFVKLAPNQLWDYSQVILAAVLGLSDAILYREFDGLYKTKVVKGLLADIARVKSSGGGEGNDIQKDVKSRKQLGQLEITFKDYLAYYKREEKAGNVVSLKSALASVMGTFTIDPVRKKENLKQWIVENCRIPSVRSTDPKEIELARHFYRFTHPSGEAYDQAFAEWAHPYRSGRVVSDAAKATYCVEVYKRTGQLDEKIRRYITPSQSSFSACARDELLKAGYDPKGAQRKSGKRAGERLSKPVICSNGITYPTAAEAGNLLSIDSSHILAACKGRRKTAGGLKFWYVDG